MQTLEKDKPQNIAGITNKITQDIEKEPVSPEAQIQAAENAAKLNTKTVLRDKDGTVFDPKIHCADDSGQPVTTKHGRYRKRPGRHAVSIPAKTESGGIRPGTYEAACAATAIFIQTSVAFFGDEWQPEVLPHTNEEDQMAAAFQRYFEVKGIVDFPPGVALSICLMSYAGRRLARPKTQSRFMQLKDALAAKFLKWRSNSGSYFNTRANGKRKDDTSEKASDKSKETGNSDFSSRSVAGRE